MALLLAGDVGGTKVFLRAFDAQTGEVLADKRLLCNDYASLTALIQSFQSEFQLSEFSAACFGLPGPVAGRKARLTNLPWEVDADLLQKNCHITSVQLINDFSASAYGIDELGADDLFTLQEGSPNSDGNRLVVGAGSGLGVAPVVKCQGVYMPQDSEGGHIDFAPLNPIQTDLFNWLHQKWQHVSYERILSGEGLESLYLFFNLQAHGHGHKNISAPQIQQFALEGDDVALKTLNVFVEVYGAFVGNAALLWKSTAGIYIAGGIAPKIIDWMKKPSFIQAAINKGRMTEQVKSLPIYLVKNEQLGLLGAVAHAKTQYQLTDK